MNPTSAFILAAFWLVFAVALVEVMRRAFREGFKPRNIAGIALFSIVVSMRVVMACMELRLSTAGVENFDGFEKPLPIPSTERIKPEVREYYTRMAARSAFWSTGKLLPVTDAEGKQHTYVPTVGDLRMREESVSTKARILQIHINGRRRLWEEIGLLAGVAVCTLLMVREDRASLRSPR
jgi:hypothetical protein